jgi:hypothetical protein
VEHDHLSKPEELIKLREGEQRNLTTAPLPIARAMQELGARGRTNYSAFPPPADITPQASNDLGPMVGWVRAPNQAVIDQINAAPAPDAADAGATPAGASADAGATPAGATADAGAPPAAPGPKAPKGPKAPPPGPHGAGAH